MDWIKEADSQLLLVVIGVLLAASGMLLALLRAAFSKIVSQNAATMLHITNTLDKIERRQDDHHRRLLTVEVEKQVRHQIQEESRT